MQSESIRDVLIVASKFPPEYAGPSHRILQTYRRLFDKGFHCSLSAICSSTEFAGNDRYQLNDVAVRRVSSRLFHRWHQLRIGVFRRASYFAKYVLEAITALWVLRHHSPNMVHILGGSPTVAMALFWGRQRNIPLIVELVTDRASPYPQLPILRDRIRPDLNKRTLIVAISEDIGNHCRSLGLKKNIWVRPNPIDEKQFCPDPETGHKLRRELTPFSVRDCVLGSVAKFMPQKNQTFLLDVLAELPVEYKLILVGPVVTEGALAKRDHGYLEKIRIRANKPDLAGRVHIVTGFVDAAAYMKISDIYLLPSLQEGLGTPLLESLATGTPVVANNNVASFQQWIDHGVNGYLCSLDPTLWADAVVKATAFSEKQRHEFSAKILSVASAARIDDQYRILIEALQDLPEDGEIDVSAVLKMENVNE